MEPFLCSLSFYAYVYVICEVLRQLVKRYKNAMPADAQQVLNEVIGTIQVCTPIFDVGFVWRHYGLLGVFIEITFLELLNAYTLGNAICNPCALWAGIRDGSLTAPHASARFLAEFVGAFMSFPIAKLFWYLHMHHDHAEKFEEIECESDLTISIFFGFAVEMVGCIVSRVVEHNSERFDKIATFINCTTSGLLTVLGLSLTGMYMNPIVASACTWNCGHEGRTGHMFVYWLGSFVGWTAAGYVNTMIGSSHGHHHRAE